MVPIMKPLGLDNNVIDSLIFKFPAKSSISILPVCNRICYTILHYKTSRICVVQSGDTEPIK